MLKIPGLHLSSIISITLIFKNRYSKCLPVRVQALGHINMQTGEMFISPRHLVPRGNVSVPLSAPKLLGDVETSVFPFLRNPTWKDKAIGPSESQTRWTPQTSWPSPARQARPTALRVPSSSLLPGSFLHLGSGSRARACFAYSDHFAHEWPDAM